MHTNADESTPLRGELSIDKTYNPTSRCLLIFSLLSILFFVYAGIIYAVAVAHLLPTTVESNTLLARSRHSESLSTNVICSPYTYTAKNGMLGFELTQEDTNTSSILQPIYETDFKIIDFSASSIIASRVALINRHGCVDRDYFAESNVIDTVLTTGNVYNALSNAKIALIERGNCTFTEKVNNAIRGGATGVIIYNGPEGNQSMTVVHASLDEPVYIPAMTASYAVGLYIQQNAARILIHMYVDGETERLRLV